MRDTGVITKGLSGDTETAAAQISAARTQLGILKNQMAANGLKVGARAVRLADGTTMHVSVAGGVSRVNIYTASASGALEEQPVIETSQFQPPEVHPVLTNHGLALFNGLMKGPNSAPYAAYLQPSIYNGALLTKPDVTPRLLAAKTIVQIYDRPDNALASNGAGASMLGVADLIQGVPLSIDQQPTGWTYTLQSGAPATGMLVFTAEQVRNLGLKTAPEGLGLILYPFSLEDEVYLVVGNDKGKPKGLIEVLKNADLVGTAAVWVDAATGAYLSTINGIQNSGPSVSTPDFFSYEINVNGGNYSSVSAGIVASMNLRCGVGPRGSNGGVGALTGAFVWTQTGGWPAGQSVPNGGVNLTTLPTYSPTATYSGSGTFSVTDLNGNTKVIPASFTLNVTWEPPV